MAKTAIKEPDLLKYLGTFTARRLADCTGVSTQYAYALIKGSSKPSFAVLKRLGVQVLYDTSGAVVAEKEGVK